MLDQAIEVAPELSLIHLEVSPKPGTRAVGWRATSARGAAPRLREVPEDRQLG